ncbi:hypothetical protein MRB53_038601 [Persea americana]|nr:hypothetical protein MRB53_038601 [Persea americana]
MVQKQEQRGPALPPYRARSASETSAARPASSVYSEWPRAMYANMHERDEIAVPELPRGYARWDRDGYGGGRGLQADLSDLGRSTACDNGGAGVLTPRKVELEMYYALCFCDANTYK